MNYPLSAEPSDLLPADCDRRVLFKLAKNLDDLIFVLDHQGMCLFSHARVPGFLFARPENCLGKTISQILPPQLQALETAISEALTRRQRPAPMEYSSPDGKQWYRICFETIAGYEHYLVAQVRNITEHYFARRLLLGLPPEIRSGPERT